jgi:hypothetical protein
MELMKRVVIESPYAGADELEILINEMYGEFCMRDCLINHHEAPYASHLLYTRSNVLSDINEEERELGIRAGFCWRDVAELTVFYQDLGMSGGMNYGMADCEDREKEYEIRLLPKNLKNEFEDKLAEAKEEFAERS